MLEVAQIRNHTAEIKERLAKRTNGDFNDLLDAILELDDRRKSTQGELDEVLAESKKMASQIGELYKSGKADEANELKAKTGELKERSNELKDALSSIEQELQENLFHVPNAPHAKVPAGAAESDNEMIRTGSMAPELHAEAAPHWELADEYGLIDFESGVKITGAGFPVYTGKGAQLQRALINFFLNEAIAAGYEEIIPPLVVNEDSGMGTGQLPDKEGQMYHIQEDDLYLIPTAEVPLTNLYRDVILGENDFPVKLCGYTPCFRREADHMAKTSADSIASTNSIKWKSFRL